MTNINLQIQEIQQTPCDKLKEIYSQTYHSQKVESQRKKEILEIGKRKMIHTKEQKCE